MKIQTGAAIITACSYAGMAFDVWLLRFVWYACMYEHLLCDCVLVEFIWIVHCVCDKSIGLCIVHVWMGNNCYLSISQELKGERPRDSGFFVTCPQTSPTLALEHLPHVIIFYLIHSKPTSCFYKLPTCLLVWFISCLWEFVYNLSASPCRLPVCLKPFEVVCGVVCTGKVGGGNELWLNLSETCLSSCRY
jgi:hypothetical protein